jgi:ribosomal protein S18 acetylase RimI-like enzyme
VVGYVHAGFATDSTESTLNFQTGSIQALIVDPAYRRRGIGRELLTRAEDYLRSHGATSIFAGPSHPCDGFYFGIYGGSQPSGFLHSDPLAEVVFRRCGYVPRQQTLVYQRQLDGGRDPIGLRLMSVRRATRLANPPAAPPRSWWWTTRAGRLDSLELCLVPRTGGDPVAFVTVVGLDFYLPSWGTRAIGLLDLHVPEEHRRKGYGQALLVELCKRVRDELIQVVDVHLAADNAAGQALLQSAGFQQVDVATVYERGGTDWAGTPAVRPHPDRSARGC